MCTKKLRLLLCKFNISSVILKTVHEVSDLGVILNRVTLLFYPISTISLQRLSGTSILQSETRVLFKLTTPHYFILFLCSYLEFTSPICGHQQQKFM